MEPLIVINGDQQFHDAEQQTMMSFNGAVDRDQRRPVRPGAVRRIGDQAFNGAVDRDQRRLGGARHVRAERPLPSMEPLIVINGDVARLAIADVSRFCLQWSR